MIHIDLPMGWNNISIDEYIQLQDITLDNEGEEMEDVIVKQIQILYNRNPLTMAMPEFRKCLDSLKFMAKPMPKMKVKDSYMLNGNKYFLHKKLEQFKMGQMIDYNRIMKEKKGIDAYPEFIALFLTPSENGDYGDGYDVDAVVKDIRKYMSIADAHSIADFFSRWCRAFIARSLYFSMLRATRAMKERKTRRELRKKTMKMIKLIISGDSPIF